MFFYREDLYEAEQKLLYTMANCNGNVEGSYKDGYFAGVTALIERLIESKTVEEQKNE